MVTVAQEFNESNPLKEIHGVLDKHTRCLTPGDPVAAVNLTIEIRDFLRDRFVELSITELMLVRDAADVLASAATVRAEEIEDAGADDE